MEEEKKELQAEEVKAEEPKAEGVSFKPALVSFILAVVGFGVACAWIAGLGGVILGAISLAFNKKNNPPTEQQPFKTFAKIAKPVAIVDIILGAIMFVVALLVIILMAVGAIVANS